MAFPITIPRLGWTMEEGVFIEWLKQEGDQVRAGDPLFILEGEKAEQEVEAIDSGILRLPPDAPRPGDVVSVGAVLGYLLAEGEAPPWEAGQTAQTSLISPIGQTGPIGQIGPTGQIGQIGRISPRARRVARQLGIEWAGISGSGLTGRIRERDVRAAATTMAPTPSAGRLVPFSPIRRLIADRMMASVRETAAVTLTTRADATNLVVLRSTLRSAAASTGDSVPTYTDFIVKMAAEALKAHSLLNAMWTEKGILMRDEINLCIAVDTQNGLVAPVIRNVGAMSLNEIAIESRRLIERAQAHHLSREDLQGGTFTITNLGMYGIDAFTPLINPPQCAVLGVGRIVREPAVVDDQVVPRDMITLSLTFDHRIVDGAPAARFLEEVRRALEGALTL